MGSACLYGSFPRVRPWLTRGYRKFAPHGGAGLAVWFQVAVSIPAARPGWPRHGIFPRRGAVRDVRDAGNDVSMQANPRLDGRAPLPSRGTSCQDAAEGRFRRTRPCKPLVHWLLQTLPEKYRGSVLPSVFFVVALQRCSMRCAQTTGNNHGGEVLPPPLRETH